MKDITPAGAAVETAYARLASTMAEKLRRRGYVPFYAPTAQDALNKVLELIPEGASVGVPGSVTVREIGAIKALKERGHTVIEHWDASLSAEEKFEARFAEAQCDVFLTSSNAITSGGVMVNIDGTGNRLAGMCWSRGDRIYVVGMNKVCTDTASAIERAHQQAAVPNAVRLSCKTPCSATGCHLEKGCVSPNSICRAILILDQAPTMPEGKTAYVILVGESLGY